MARSSNSREMDWFHILAAALEEDETALDRLVASGVNLDHCLGPAGILESMPSVNRSACSNPAGLVALYLLGIQGKLHGIEGELHGLKGRLHATSAAVAELSANLDREMLHLSFSDVPCFNAVELADRNDDLDAWGNAAGMAALHFLAVQGSERGIELLIRKGANIDVQFQKGSAPVHKGYTPLHLAVLGGHVAVVQKLIELGANVHAQSSEGCTALHTVVSYGEGPSSCAILSVLLERGGDADLRLDEKGDTPLHCVTLYGNAEMLGEFIKAYNCSGRPSAHPGLEAPNLKRRTALHYAAGKQASMPAMNTAPPRSILPHALETPNFWSFSGRSLSITPQQALAEQLCTLPPGMDTLKPSNGCLRRELRLTSLMQEEQQFD